MTIGIYGLFDRETGECLYVGQSSDIEYRVRQHRKKLKNGSHLSSFNNWFLLSGSDLANIEYRVLEECQNDDVTKNLAEIRWFHELSPKFFGKIPSDAETWGMSQETKDKISKSNRAYSETIRGGAPRLIDRVLLCGFCRKSYSSVYRGSKYCSKKCQASHVDEELVDKMVALYEDGMSTRDISGIVGFSFKTVSRHLRRRDVALRGRGASRG